MNEPIYIEKKSSDNLLTNFYKLREEAIKIVQDLSGNIWTDYNLHDPGITIIEQLCYALTELIYKANADVQDILAGKESDQIDYRNQGLYLPHEIFSSKAVTINDFRKIIYDALPELNNVWLYPESKDTVKGFYTIILAVDNTKIVTEETKNEIKHKVEEVFYRNRNLCEDVLNIKTLKTKSFEINALLNVNKEQTPEDILAEVYFNISCYLSDEIKFYSFEELLEQNYSLEEIFSGPLLENGYILNKELKPKKQEIKIEEVFQEIASVQGITGIHSAEIFIEKEKVKEKVIPQREPEQGLNLYIPNNYTEENIHILLVRNGRILKPNLLEVKNKYYLLKSRFKNRRIQNRELNNYINIPKGKYINLSDYYSIQNNFPSIYGIGNDGHNINKSQVAQLKAYLLIFEQIFANYNQQLESLKDLFSLSNIQKKTYFSQPLKGVPNIFGLYTNLNVDTLNKPSQTEFNKYIASVNEKVENLVSKFDNYLNRKNRVLDYLLALYGEKLTQNTLSQFNYYFKPEEIEEEKINNKVYFLANLPELNKNKLKGFSYKDKAWNTHNTSGLEQRASIFLNIKQNKDKSCVKIFERDGLELISGQQADVSPKTDLKVYTAKHFNEEEIENHFSFVSFSKGYDETSPDSAKEIIENIFPLNDKLINEQFLRSGIDSKAYKIGHLQDTQEYSLVHFFRRKGIWEEIGCFETYEQAYEMTEKLRNYLIMLNIESEGLHLIEHLLLKSSAGKDLHKFYAYNNQQEKVFSWYSSLKDEIQFEAINNLSAIENYTIRSLKKNSYTLEVQLNKKESILSSVQFESEKEATAYLNDFIQHINRAREKKSIDRVIQSNCFYSFGVSVLLPSWPARFNNNRFKTLAEETVKACAPAHIKLNFYWLKPDKIQEFEHLYVKWLELIQHKTENETEYAVQNQKIVDFLVNNKN